MPAVMRRNLLSDIQDRLLHLYALRQEAGKSGDWRLADSIDEEISAVKVHREEICNRDAVESP